MQIDPSQNPEALLGDIHAYITQTEMKIEARSPVDLSGLDVAVAALCKRVLEMEESESKKYSAHLNQLMEAIEAMQAKMMTLQSEVAKAIKTLDVQKKAAKAYINAPRVEK